MATASKTLVRRPRHGGGGVTVAGAGTVEIAGVDHRDPLPVPAGGGAADHGRGGDRDHPPDQVRAPGGRPEHDRAAERVAGAVGGAGHGFQEADQVAAELVERSGRLAEAGPPMSADVVGEAADAGQAGL